MIGWTEGIGNWYIDVSLSNLVLNYFKNSQHERIKYSGIRVLIFIQIKFIGFFPGIFLVKLFLYKKKIKKNQIKFIEFFQ